MFDIGWSEVLVIAIVAVVVVGPKELPRMLRTFGKTMGTVRRTANDFKRQFDEALREAERDADLEDTRKSLQSIAKMDPLADLKKDLDLSKPAARSAAAAPAPSPTLEKPAAEPHAAEPVKTGAVGPEVGTGAS